MVSTAPQKFDPDLLAYLKPEELGRLRSLLAQQRKVWEPLPGPQTMAFESTADVVGYGGAAGGGKTDLICGKALREHKRVLIVRREKDQTQGVVQRLQEIIGSTDGYNSQRSRWDVGIGSRALIEFGGLDHLGDEKRWQGRPHDLIAPDEATEMREAQVRFLLGWCRTSDPKQRCQVLLTFNPPTSAEGRWIIKFFGPWLDKSHPSYPAKPGEIRWFARSEDGNHDIEVKDARPFVFVKGQPTYRFDARKHKPEHIIRPKSRTFIPARVTDNRYYMESGYMSQLQSLPEPLRSQMLLGDFQAGTKDAAYQVIPTKWVEIAQARWKQPERLKRMDSLGCDVAMGGPDKTALMTRHEMWFSQPIVHTGKESTDGPTIAGWCVGAVRDEAVIHIDVLGPGSEPYAHLMAMGLQVIGVVMGDKVDQVTANGRLGFFNVRSMLWWRMREALDPAANTGICLPPSQELLADLTAPLWKPQGAQIKVESRDDIVKRIGRSPDLGTAAILALIDTPKERELAELQGGKTVHRYDPLRYLDETHGREDGGGRDPLTRLR